MRNGAAPKLSLSASQLLGLFKKGVGTGHNSEYTGWVTTENTDTASHSGKYLCKVDGRYRHFLSDTEEGMLLGCLRDEFVTGLRENLPLTIAVTERLCKGFRFQHPRSSGQGKPLVPFTTDLVVSRSKPPKYVAISGRLRTRLRKIADCRSLLVEHAYWSLNDVPFLLATDVQISKNVLTSLGNLQPKSQLAEGGLLDDRLCRQFHTAALKADWSQPLVEVVRDISAHLRLSSDQGMEIFKRLAWAGEFDVDMERPVTPQARNVVIIGRPQ